MAPDKRAKKQESKVPKMQRTDDKIIEDLKDDMNIPPPSEDIVDSMNGMNISSAKRVATMPHSSQLIVRQDHNEVVKEVFKTNDYSVAFGVPAHESIAPPNDYYKNKKMPSLWQLWILIWAPWIKWCISNGIIPEYALNVEDNASWASTQRIISILWALYNKYMFDVEFINKLVIIDMENSDPTTSGIYQIFHVYEREITLKIAELNINSDIRANKRDIDTSNTIIKTIMVNGSIDYAKAIKTIPYDFKIKTFHIEGVQIERLGLDPLGEDMGIIATMKNGHKFQYTLDGDKLNKARA